MCTVCCAVFGRIILRISHATNSENVNNITFLVINKHNIINVYNIIGINLNCTYRRLRAPFTAHVGGGLGYRTERATRVTIGTWGNKLYGYLTDRYTECICVTLYNYLLCI